jgi:hypothetical protein
MKCSDSSDGLGKPGNLLASAHIRSRALSFSTYARGAYTLKEWLSHFANGGTGGIPG